MKSQNFVKLVLGGTVAALVLIGGATAVIDPFLHYHPPLENLQYPLDNERYQNDGIIKQYDYNAAIVGTSMTQNFKASQFQELFGAAAIKVPLTGESYYVIDQSVRRILDINPNTKYILRSLDYTKMLLDKDTVLYDDYPAYLYDDNLFNDVSYVFNKEIFFDYTLGTLEYTAEGFTTPTMDEYSSWEEKYPLGKNIVLKGYDRPMETQNSRSLTEEEIQRLTENVQQNIIQTAIDHPDTEFYLFYPPYSICWWDRLMRIKRIDTYWEAEKLQTELLLPYSNIHVYSFADQYDITCNLDNYKDITHYGAHISEQIMNWIKDGTGLLTADNYLDRMNAIKEFYQNYDYTQIFGES